MYIHGCQSKYPEAYTYQPANGTGCGGSGVDDFHVLITWKTFMSFHLVTIWIQPSLRDRMLKAPLSISTRKRGHHHNVIHTMSSRYFFFRDWWRSRSWLAMSLYWSLSCWHVSSSLERISRASFLLSSFLLHTRYCRINTSMWLRTVIKPPSFHPRWSSHSAGLILLCCFLSSEIIYPETFVIQWHTSPKAAKVPDTVPLWQNQNRGHSWSLANWDRENNW